MSFIHLTSLASLAPLAHRNSSAQNLVQVPANLLETFIPGYGTISRIPLDTFGIDVTLLVSISFFFFALGRSFTYLKNQFLALVMRFGTCSVEIGADADTYFWVMDWMADRGIGQDSHHLTAIATQRNHIYVHGDDRDFDLPPHLPVLTSSRKKQNPQRYEPSLGQTQYFWFNNRLFRWHRQNESQNHRYPRIEGRLYCLSRTTAPIKALIDEASEHYHKKRACNTAIRRPAPRMQRYQGMNVWKTVAMRPSRPLHTVVLGDEQKKQLLSDIDEYLQPHTRQWYAVRGIPYRRGYLFFGPPGTGKTSLAFAIAGFFGLDVYCVSLAEPTISEEDLVSLFDELPVQCLVLLEDVDSAGLVVRRGKAPKVDNSRHMPDPDSRDDDSNSQTNGISLSGLLNVIDGIASQEGRVLIMTTNHVSSLDAALLRPGRVDLRVPFELAGRKQAEDLFLQTFTDTDSEDPEKNKGMDVKEKCELEDMSRKFAAEIPDKALSPAEIQGFLMNWKKKPADAVAKVKEWVEENTNKADPPPSKMVNGNHVPSR